MHAQNQSLVHGEGGADERKPKPAAVARSPPFSSPAKIVASPFADVVEALARTRSKPA